MQCHNGRGKGQVRLRLGKKGEREEDRGDGIGLSGIERGEKKTSAGSFFAALAAGVTY